MRRIFLVLCCLLVAGPALAATPEREALLARLKAAMPTMRVQFGSLDAQDVRQALLPLNPGREEEVETLASARFACLNALMSDATVRDLVIEIVDERVSQDGLETLVAFYESAEVKVAAEVEHLPADDPHRLEAYRKVGARIGLEVSRFPLMVQRAVRNHMGSATAQDGIATCESNHRAALKASGLVLPQEP